MEALIPLFFGTFSTLLAVINPLEAMPVFLQLLQRQDKEAHHRVAFKSCLYATLLMATKY
jgi:multiple antibiotic resistance protein